MKQILSRLEPERAITREEAYQLAEVQADDLPLLLLAASSLRTRGKGKMISYSKKVFIPLTTACHNRCGYCGFRREPRDARRSVLDPEQVLAVARKGEQAGCREALLTLGERPEGSYPLVRERLKQLGCDSTVEYIGKVSRLILDQTGLLPHTNAGVLARDEMAALKEVNASLGLMLESTSERLLGPGGPHQHSPGKDPRTRLRALEDAGELRIPFTTGILIGIGETPRERIDAFFAIKEIQERYGHIQEVIVQNFRAQNGTPMAGCPEPAPLDMLRTLGLARLILGPEMNIQAPPNLSRGGYQAFLLAGLNDWGGISPVTKDFINPGSPWPAILELQRQTESAGFRLQERLAVYPEYIGRKPGFLPSGLRERILALVDSDGYVKRGEGA